MTIVHTGAPDELDLKRWKRIFREEYHAELLFLQELPSEAHVPVMPQTARHQTAHLVYEWLRRQDFQTIYFQDWRGNGSVCTQAKRAGWAFADSRLVVITHRSAEWIREGMLGFSAEGRETLIDDALERGSVVQADLVVSPSRYTLDCLSCHRCFFQTRFA